jgi:hypothetical protein
MRPVRRKKGALFTVILLLLVILICEGLSHVAERLLTSVIVGVDFTPTRTIYENQRNSIKRRFDHETKATFDADLGWRFRQIIRGDGELSLSPSNDKTRIAVFGDSFVYGAEVQDHQSWPFQLQSVVPTIQVLNFGVPGYGTDQSYLMYKKYGRQFKPRIVLIGFTTVQLPRNLSVYRRFFSPDETLSVKPRFILSANGDLTLIPSPIRSESEYWKYYTEPTLVTEFGQHDYWYSPFVYRNPLYDYSATIRVMSQALTVIGRKLSNRNSIVSGGRLNPESETFEITTKLLRLFSQEASSDGSVPIILLFPGGDQLGADETQKFPVYKPVVEYLQRQGLEYLDLAEAFDEPVTRDRHFMPSGHYSPHSNGLVARRIAAYLDERGLIQ